MQYFRTLRQETRLEESVRQDITWFKDEDPPFITRMVKEVINKIKMGDPKVCALKYRRGVRAITLRCLIARGGARIGREEKHARSNWLLTKNK